MQQPSFHLKWSVRALRKQKRLWRSFASPKPNTNLCFWRLRRRQKGVTMPTESGEGFADYVLYGDDGKPLAVIEAKKTAKEARAGAEQARMYANCLEKETGARPVIFFTNGPDIFLWDDVQSYPYRKVYG